MMTSTLILCAVITLTAFAGYNAESDDCKRDVVFVVDESHSIRDSNPRGTSNGSPQDNWRKQIDFIISVVNGTGETSGINVGVNGSRVGLVTFSNGGRFHWDFNAHTNAEDLIEALEQVPLVGGRTNTYEGLHLAKTEIFTPDGGDRPDVADTIILLSDGAPTHNVSELDPYARELRELHEIHIIGVGVSNKVNESSFRPLVSLPFEENYSHVEDFDALQGIVNNIINETCTTIAPQGVTERGNCDDDPCSNDGECNQVTLFRITCTCPDGFIGNLCKDYAEGYTTGTASKSTVTSYLIMTVLLVITTVYVF